MEIFSLSISFTSTSHSKIMFYLLLTHHQVTFKLVDSNLKPYGHKPASLTTKLPLPPFFFAPVFIPPLLFLSFPNFSPSPSIPLSYLPLFLLLLFFSFLSFSFSFFLFNSSAQENPGEAPKWSHRRDWREGWWRRGEAESWERRDRVR